MKKNTLLFLLMIASTFATAQQLYLETGKTMSSFDYTNSQNEKLGNLQQTAHTFMEIGYRDRVISNQQQLKGSLGIRYAGYGAIGSDNEVGNFMEWNVNYLELSVGLDQQLFKIKKASVYLKGSASYGFLVQGTQTINNRVINLKKIEEFDKPILNFRVGTGFSHPISENLSFYVQYMYGKSVVWVAKPEKLRIGSNNVSFGLLVNLSNKTR
ncbi:outer membrane beta-barrel protein [Flavobacterium xanthum]|uniref:Outer membrane protein beta-barrel domain-containing protein n=1 Tax=Flavobacterium xanthum TaxID=69322 RepID=A0A1M7F509_9FLAO|nr:outer membrane beta-barrel protein [Flavobacterium xanthum]SHL99093.1 Outer membrane protein beta-barrel domain-containing protein [Flavobacterium xanthum]